MQTSLECPLIEPFIELISFTFPHYFISGMQAETDSDEVYAQIMLQPEADVSRLTYIIFLWISIFSFCYCLFVLCIYNSVHGQYYMCWRWLIFLEFT